MVRALTYWHVEALYLPGSNAYWLWWTLNFLFFAELSFAGDLGCTASLLDSAEMRKCSVAMPAISVAVEMQHYHSHFTQLLLPPENSFLWRNREMYLPSAQHSTYNPQPILVRYAVTAKSELKVSLLKIADCFSFHCENVHLIYKAWQFKCN